MTDIVPIDHTELALDRLISQYKNSPNLKAYISIFTDQLQELEDAGFDLLNFRDLDSAYGAQVDLLARVVNAERDTAGYTVDDATLIQLIKLKVLRNYTKCDTNDIIYIHSFIYETTNIIITESQANYCVIIGKVLSPFEIALANALDSRGLRVLPKPIGIGVCYGWYDPDNVFSFFDDPDPASLGFGDSNNPSIGGAWAELI